MKSVFYLKSKHCRWCGIAYMAHQPVGRDGFCSSKHRQAHHRAFNRYVTTINDRTRVQKNS